MVYLFDLDGTIIDSQIGITRGLAYAIEKMKLPKLPQERLIEFIGPSFVEIFPLAFGLDFNDTKKMIAYYREYYSKKGKNECVLYDGMYELLKDLNSEGHHLYMATAKPENLAREISESLDIYKFFKGLVGATEDESRHKKEDVIEELIRRHGPLEKAYMIGDRASDLIAAKKKKMGSIGVLYGFAKDGELERENPDYICKDVPSLRKLLLEKL